MMQLESVLKQNPSSQSWFFHNSVQFTIEAQGLKDMVKFTKEPQLVDFYQTIVVWLIQTT